MAIQDTLALLEQQITEIDNQKNAALLETQVVKAKLDTAKQKAAQIKTLSTQIGTLSDEIVAI